MSEIPTAEEFFNQTYRPHFNQAEATAKVMIEFAKLHVTAALKEASEKVIMKDLNENCHYEDEDGNFPDCLVIDRDSILNSYPLEKIQ